MSPSSKPRTSTQPRLTQVSGLADADVAAFYRVLDHAQTLDPDSTEAKTLRLATGRLFKVAKRERKHIAKSKVRNADRAVVAATATGNPQRIDDETEGLLITTPTRGDSAGEYQKPIGCYICKALFTRVDAFYHQLCPECAHSSHARRDATVDLSGRRALLTGGRAKIGMYIALRLLRDGAHLTITTRFPRDATRRFTAMNDSAAWLHQLKIVGIDLRDPAQVIALADEVAAAGPLDILINNAAQTVRRSGDAYAPLAAAENDSLPAGTLPEILTFGHISDAHPASLAEALASQSVSHIDPETRAFTAANLTQDALAGGSTSVERMNAGTAIDAGGLIPDLAPTNSWVDQVQDVSPLEMLEVQLCNMTAPFILVSRLRPALAASNARRKYIVNVSAMEGQFSRRYKGSGHPHTNMAKAAINMLTRTSSAEMFETDQILMTAVDTGWITDERPHATKMRLHEAGFHAPLDLVDGAARVYDPIVQGEAGQDIYGCFLKDYKPSPW